MAAKEEAVEKEKRIGEGKIERKEEHPLGRTKIDGARDIDSYTHKHIHTKCIFKFIFVSFQNGLAGKGNIKEEGFQVLHDFVKIFGKRRRFQKSRKSLKNGRSRKNLEELGRHRS